MDTPASGLACALFIISVPINSRTPCTFVVGQVSAALGEMLLLPGRHTAGMAPGVTPWTDAVAGRRADGHQTTAGRLGRTHHLADHRQVCTASMPWGWPMQQAQQAQRERHRRAGPVRPAVGQSAHAAICTSAGRSACLGQLRGCLVALILNTLHNSMARSRHAGLRRQAQLAQQEPRQT